MLTSYNLHAFRHQMLHRFMMRFFATMITMIKDGKTFGDDVFHPSFLPIAKRHKKLIYDNCKTVYEQNLQLYATDRETALALWERMQQGLDVEKICCGEAMAVRVTEIPEPLSGQLKEMFEKLYTSILRGSDETAYVKRYGSIRKHFECFHTRNEEITVCPFCGISPVRTDAMMEYDHYLPKSLYPFHAVNLQNLVPACKDCNQTEKKDYDVLAGGKIFYPYKKNHKGIDVDYHITPEPDFSQSEWSVILNSRDKLSEELNNWMKIYDIQNRYQNFAKIRADKWFKMFWSFALKRMKKGNSLDMVVDFFTDFLDEEAEHKENFLRKPAYKAMFRDTSILEAIEKSRDPT